MTTEEKVCRFCLGSNESIENFLISPCDCNGSIQYVHNYCLTRWRISQTPSIDTCSMCKTEYKVGLCFSLELLYMTARQITNSLQNGFVFFFLFNSLFAFILNIYNQRAINNNIHNMIMYDYEKSYNAFYKMVMIILMGVYNGLLYGSLVNVVNKRRYFYYWVGSRQFLKLLLLPACMVTIYYSENRYFIGGILHVIYYPLFFSEHKKILENINRDLIEDVQQFQ